MAILIEEYYLRSIPRTGILYSLVIRLGSPISKDEFEQALDYLNKGILAIKGVFSSANLLDENTVNLYYSLAFPDTGLTQQQILDEISSSFSKHNPSIDWQESQGETTELPLVSPQQRVDWLTAFRNLFDTTFEFFQERPWLVYLIIGGTAITAFIAISEKLPKFKEIIK